jgi:hypothetical protein
MGEACSHGLVKSVQIVRFRSTVLEMVAHADEK